jgi:membrane-associated phospholipid phosphatase
MIPLGRARRLASLAVAFVALETFYTTIGVSMDHAGRPLHLVDTPLDHLVPLQPAWVLIYAMVFLQALAPIATISDVRVLDRTLLAYASMYMVGTPLWVLYPVTVPRDPVPIVDLWTYGLGLVRLADPPTNCFPSMHVALATMAALVVWRHDRGMGKTLAVSAALIWYSTLATRQHWMLDGLAGVTLACLADALWFRLRPLPEAAFQALPRWWHLTWFGVYVGAVAILMSGWWFGWVPVTKLPPNVNPWVEPTVVR